MALGRISRHTAYIMDRGGARRIGQIKGLSLVRWNRVRDDISESTLRLATPKYLSPQWKLLEELEPNRHEICIYRDGVRSWEGPVSLLTSSSKSVEIHSEDVMRYAHGTTMRAGYDSSYPNVEYVTSRAARILRAEMARKEAMDPPYNVLPYLVEHHAATDAQTTAISLPYQYQVFEHIDDMAAKKGMDYTVVGRAIHLWDTSRNVMGQTRTATQADFLGELYVSVYGKEGATMAHATDGQGNVGTAGADDPFYGEWERLATAYDETDEDAEVPSIAELTSQAQRNLAGRNPVPLQVRVPDNSGINPNGILKIEDLVPGVYIPVRAVLGVRRVSQMQKLDLVTVEETPKGETITVTMAPATNPDEVE